LKTGERGREESRERGGWCWVRAGCDTFVLVVIAVEIGLLVDVNATHLQWLTGIKNVRDVLELEWREDILWWRFFLDL